MTKANSARASCTICWSSQSLGESSRLEWCGAADPFLPPGGWISGTRTAKTCAISLLAHPPFIRHFREFRHTKCCFENQKLRRKS